MKRIEYRTTDGGVFVRYLPETDEERRELEARDEGETFEEFLHPGDDDPEADWPLDPNAEVYDGEPLRFYSHTRGPLAFLSNFYPSRFTTSDGRVWPTVEHYFQAMKFLDHERQEEVRRAPSPAEAKRLGRRPGIREDWTKVRIDVMREGLRAKFGQRPELRAGLIATGGAHLVEAAPRDFFWGEGADGSGQNWLGRLLVELRRDLTQALGEELFRIARDLEDAVGPKTR